MAQCRRRGYRICVTCGYGSNRDAPFSLPFFFFFGEVGERGVLTVERVGWYVAAHQSRTFPSRCKSVTKSQLLRSAQVNPMGQSVLPTTS